MDLARAGLTIRLSMSLAHKQTKGQLRSRPREPIAMRTRLRLFWLTIFQSSLGMLRFARLRYYMQGCTSGHGGVYIWLLPICVHAHNYKHTMIRAYKVTKKNPYIQIYGEKSAKKVKIVWR